MAAAALRLQARVGNRAASRSIQRRLRVSGEKDKWVDPGNKRLLTLREWLNGERADLPKTVAKHPLAKILKRDPSRANALAILDQLLAWAAAPAGQDEEHPGWEEAVRRARAALQIQAKGATAPSALLDAIAVNEKMLEESDLTPEMRTKLVEEDLPRLRREASFGTGIFDELLYETKAGDPKSGEKRKGETVPMPVERRKRHKAGGGRTLPAQTVTYKSYRGTIVSGASDWVLGKLPVDYKDLLAELVKRVGQETAPPRGVRRETDRDVAGRLLRELDGADGFEGFTDETRRYAHKFVALVFFAELSRHSLAPVSAAAALAAVARRDENEEAPGLVESFATGSTQVRPLFVGEHGAGLLRGEPSRNLSEKTVRERETRAALDITNYFKATHRKDEPFDAFVRRRTLEMVAALQPHTGAEPLGFAGVDPALFSRLRRIRPPRTAGDPIATLTALGFTRHVMAVSDNDCALRTIHHQLTLRSVDVGPFDAFRDAVRADANLPYGEMIDILNHGTALLTAVRTYLGTRPGGPRGLTIDAWAATAAGGVMEFQDVARVDGPNPMVLTFYFDGTNHFDSLTGGALCRL